MVRKDAVKDLIKIKNEFDSVVESLALMSDKEFLDSFKKSKAEIRNRDFADWNEL
jgi:hypothetical protein